MVKQFEACLVILRSQVDDNINLDSLFHFEPNLGQVIFYISLTKFKKNGIKRVLELNMARMESRGHGKVLAHFGNLVFCTNEVIKVLDDLIGVWTLDKSFIEVQKSHFSQRSLAIV